MNGSCDDRWVKVSKLQTETCVAGWNARENLDAHGWQARENI